MPANQLTTSPLSSLMKQNLGVTRVSKLTFAANDTIYAKFRKLGTYIERNGDFTRADEQAGVEQMAYVRSLPQAGQSYAVQSQALAADDPRVAPFGIPNAHAYLVTETIGDRDPKETVFILDPQNKQSTAHNQTYLERSHFQQAVLGNVNRAIGFGKLQTALLERYDQAAANQAMAFTRQELMEKLSELNNGRYGGQRYHHWFAHRGTGDVTDRELAALEQTPDGFKDGRYRIRLGDGYIHLRTREEVEADRHFNHIVDYIDDYMMNTYDVVLQQKHEREIEATTRARAWTTKKNINQETQAVMDQTSLREHYAFVELDNDVDLNLFQQFETEVNRIQAVLPTVPENDQPTLRLRKLGNYKAAGLYVPSFNTIAIDFRDRNDKDGLGVSGGIASFVHEYGHYLDYRLADWPNGETTTLSMRPEFARVANNYQNALAKSNLSGSDLGYFSAPTEIFARAFELYVSKKGLQTPLLDQPAVYQTAPEYAVVDNELQGLIDQYFDTQFPDLAPAIAQLQKPAATPEQSPEPQVQPDPAKRVEPSESVVPTEGNKKEGSKYTPSSQVELAGSGLPDRDNSAQKFADPSEENQTTEAEADEAQRSSETSESVSGSSEVAENDGNKKEELDYTPYSQTKSVGSGLPDQDNLTHKFTSSSDGDITTEAEVNEGQGSQETSESVSGSSGVVENEGNKKEAPWYTPYSQAEPTGSGLPDRENSAQKFAGSSDGDSTTEAEVNEAQSSQETSESVPGSSEVAKNEGNKKEEPPYTPYSQAELAGSGLPDQEDLAQKFAGSSYRYFTITGGRGQSSN